MWLSGCTFLPGLMTELKSCGNNWNSGVLTLIVAAPEYLKYRFQEDCSFREREIVRKSTSYGIPGSEKTRLLAGQGTFVAFS